MRTGSRKRRSLRRAVELECALQSDLWDGMVSLAATNVSNEGVWIDTPYTLDPGEELVLSFLPPGARQGEEVWAVAEVARVGIWRRRLDPWPAGMGLTFRYLSNVDRHFLARSLVGYPPRLPRRRGPPPLPGTRGHYGGDERRTHATVLSLVDVTFLDTPMRASSERLKLL
ncbi:MAG: hypothetical protein QM778_02970 [Myxococcales bacterium]